LIDFRFDHCSKLKLKTAKLLNQKPNLLSQSFTFSVCRPLTSTLPVFSTMGELEVIFESSSMNF